MSGKGTADVAGVLRDRTSCCVPGCKKFPVSASTDEKQQHKDLRSGQVHLDYKVCALNARPTKSCLKRKR